MVNLNELTPLQLRLAVLDAFLTRTGWVEVVRSDKRQGGVEKISQTTYYLSDGGYSRISIGPLGWCEYAWCEDGETGVFLDPVSTSTVKSNWTLCKELVEDVARAATNEWKALGY